MIPVKAVAVFRMQDENGQDDKLLCVPQDDPNWADVEALEDVSERLRAEIEHFWTIIGEGVEIEGWEDRDAALEVLEESRRAFRG
jgi:inorganic pyrophosphatase